jgi:multimeric flavodoxin WrbA
VLNPSLFVSLHIKGNEIMTKIVVVYHSGYGHTKRLADAVAEAAKASIIAIDAEGNIPDAAWDTITAADAIIFGSPTYMGGPSWQFKKFADATSKLWYTQALKNKLFAGFTNSASMNGDKAFTINAFITIALQHGGLWVGPGLMPSSTKAAQRNDINYLGAYSGLMGQTPADAAPEEMLAGDLATATAFGQRVAEVAARIKA